MTEVIYVDVLVAINIFVTYLLLAASAFFSAVPAKRWRLLLSSLLGGASALLIFLPPAPWWLLLPEKLLCGLLIVWAAFGFGGCRRFLRCFAAFFAANFAFAGIMLALWLTLHPGGMFYQNGAVYFDIGLITLVIFACICYSLVRGTAVLLRRRHPGANACQATIQMPGSSITLPALYDSGNKLTDGFTGAPVIVAEFAALQGFLPEGLHPFFRGEESIALLPETESWRGRVREIPFHSLGREGLLPAFRSDQVTVKTKAKATPTPQAIVAVTTQSLSDGSYSVILQASMLEK
ncbi:MAG: sigma-E processing peptidase SpoIIGA [Oscillospiraceae bacterium]|jgi:stage II sporulation protein GA (sporulation sigma-E factor processing peptidase)|nr:sigma-E processing peptidase SpoIIGA [Oscillospiraceae bacterium]